MPGLGLCSVARDFSFAGFSEEPMIPWWTVSPGEFIFGGVTLITRIVPLSWAASLEQTILQ